MALMPYTDNRTRTGALGGGASGGLRRSGRNFVAAKGGKLGTVDGRRRSGLRDTKK